jgi:hypothetical protein
MFLIFRLYFAEVICFAEEVRTVLVCCMCGTWTACEQILYSKIFY